MNILRYILRITLILIFLFSFSFLIFPLFFIYFIRDCIGEMYSNTYIGDALIDVMDIPDKAMSLIKKITI